MSVAPGLDHAGALPAPLTPLIGRERETAEVCALLRRDDVRLAAALVFFWYYHGHFGEGRRWLELALVAAQEAPVSEDIRATALWGLAFFAENQGEYEQAMAQAGESLSLRRHLGDPRSIATALIRVGSALKAQGRYEEATAPFDEALALVRSVGDKIWASVVLYHLGAVDYGLGDRERAVVRFEESIGLFEEAGNRFDAAHPIQYRGLVACEQRDFTRAATCFADCLTRWREQGSKQVIAFGLTSVATFAVACGQPERAARLFGAADALLQAVGAPLALPWRTIFERAIVAARAALGADASTVAWTAGRTMALDQALVEADVVLTTARAPAAGTPNAPSTSAGLTAKELEVLCLLAQGLTNSEIAASLFISHGTARSHVDHIYTKLGVRSRAEATNYALRHGLC